MFDCHMHTRVSFDGHDSAIAMARAAAAMGLKEICFTDHQDYDPLASRQTMLLDMAAYTAEFAGLELPGLRIGRGMEFGLMEDNRDVFARDARMYPFDFILGSVHFTDGLDVYFQEYWQGKTVFQAERRYLEQTLACVTHHDGFDVLAHLSYICKTTANPAPRPLPYEEHRELVDAILAELVRKGKGLELNTSGMDRCGGFLPTADIFRRFYQLGGRIVTVGSDAHRPDRVGQYSKEASRLLGDIFGGVYTFRQREPVFHRL